MERLVLDNNWKIIINDKENIKGDHALYSNILACLSVGETMKSLLGPKSRDKLIINQYGEIIITNDGITVLKSMNLIHPVSRMMVELSKSMDDQNGDGTTSVVVLCSLLLKKSLSLLKGDSLSNFNISRGIHPIRIMRGFIKASKISIDTIKKISKRFDINSDQGKEILLQVSTTTLNSKLVSHIYPNLPKLAVDSILLAYKFSKSNLTTQSVNIVGVSSGSMEDSKILPYFLLPHSLITPFYPKQSNSKEFNIVLLDLLFLNNNNNNSKDITESFQNNEIIIKNDKDIESLIQEQESKVKSLVITLKKFGISIVGVGGNDGTLAPLVRSYFNKAKISVFKPFDRDEFTNLSDRLGISILSDISNLSLNTTSSFIGKFKNIKQEIIQSRELYHFEPLDTISTPPTIILYGSTDIELQETKRALHDSLCVLRNLIRDPVVVPGGGACEIQCCNVILSTIANENIDGLEMIVLTAFTEALEEIAQILYQNSGIENHLELILKLKDYHRVNESNASFGIDLRTETMGDMYDLGVLETCSNKLSQISMVTEIVSSILKIDEIINH
ncbi:hypothetical protein CYY_000316 [Polysphondylium violaceum]|uniref:Uncharacterized protein n=1 Tax=Polysphondylium violaceum TaxID=133409 RepID=A0A8J4V911_9MYCE|nr:hypothetical protein CYY_000316 [Polysphondylium violaceum]